MLISLNIIVITVLLIFLITNCISIYNIKQNFESKFNKTCLNYPFIQLYNNILQNPSNKYTIFVFYEHNADLGGLGDRLAGLISAFAHSLRFNRTLLIENHPKFNDYFTPYNYRNISWDKINMQGLNYTANRVHADIYCINPRQSNRECTFDDDFDSSIIRIKSNRAFLCRWSTIESLHLNESLLRTLGIDKSTNLFEVAGCLLRLLMWPTDLLWNEVNSHINSTPDILNVTSTLLLGFHFRCGDNSIQNSNSQCYFNSKDSWNGIKMFGDISADSPIDLAHCGQSIINNHYNNTNLLIYVASDSNLSIKQISENIIINSNQIINPTSACHVNKEHNCFGHTLLHWFLLSLSDIIITQALTDIHNFDIHDSNYNYNSYELSPPSSFSRYAAVYGLSTNQIRYGSYCKTINATRLSIHTQGNWVCNPKELY